jgi:hypothetical protein
MPLAAEKLEEQLPYLFTFHSIVLYNAVTKGYYVLYQVYTKFNKSTSIHLPLTLIRYRVPSLSPTLFMNLQKVWRKLEFRV